MDIVLSDLGDSARNFNATASLLLGIFSLGIWTIPYIGLFVAILGLINAIKGQRSQIKSIARIGLILSIIGLVASAATSGIDLYIVSFSFQL